MNQESRDKWVNQILNDIFLAVIASKPLREALVFKGARILNLYLGESRQSLDIDSNISPGMAATVHDLDAQADFLAREVPLALRRHFEQQNPVRLTLGKVKVDRNPPKGHPRAWDAFKLRIEVRDNALAGVIALPRLEIEVAAPETLGPDAVQTMPVHGHPARVYTLHRIAGEKLRAYLTSLPAYRRKMRGGERDFRVKDLHDIARILQARPAIDQQFWNAAGLEFQLACESRLVDCAGPESFLESWPLARERYAADQSLKAVPFAEAEAAIKTTAGLLESQGIFPLIYPLRQPATV